MSETTKYYWHADQAKIEADFVRLETLLKANPLPCTGEGGYRLASADEFMWMYDHPTMGVGFKHRDSRRYVYVAVRCGVDVLTVSVNDMFDSESVDFDDDV